MPRTRGLSSRRTASLALRPLCRQSGVVVAGRTADSGEGRGASPPALPGRTYARTRDTSVAAEVVIARARALGECRSDSIPARLPPALTARRNVRFFGGFFFFGGPAQ